MTKRIKIEIKTPRRVGRQGSPTHKEGTVTK